MAISVDSPEQTRPIVAAHGFGFPLLSDPHGRALDAFGVRHVGGGMDGDIARPAVFVVDREGRVVWRELTDNWRVRVRPDQILRVVDQIP